MLTAHVEAALRGTPAHLVDEVADRLNALHASLEHIILPDRTSIDEAMLKELVGTATGRPVNKVEYITLANVHCSDSLWGRFHNGQMARLMNVASHTLDENVLEAIETVYQTLVECADKALEEYVEDANHRMELSLAYGQAAAETAVVYLTLLVTERHERAAEVAALLPQFARLPLITRWQHTLIVIVAD